MYNIVVANASVVIWTSVVGINPAKHVAAKTAQP